jgi:type II secretory pathway component PulK
MIADRFRSRNSAKDGSAILIAVLYLSIVTLFASALLRHYHITMASAQSAQNHEVCAHVAEAGLEKAIAILHNQRDYRGERGTTLGGGAFTVSVVSGGNAGSFRLVSAAKLTRNESIVETIAADIEFDRNRVVRVTRWSRVGRDPDTKD